MNIYGISKCNTAFPVYYGTYKKSQDERLIFAFSLHLCISKAEKCLSAARLLCPGCSHTCLAGVLQGHGQRTLHGGNWAAPPAKQQGTTLGVEWEPDVMEPSSALLKHIGHWLTRCVFRKSGFVYLYVWTMWKRRKINSWPRHESSSAVQSATGLKWQSRASCCVYASGSLWWRHYRGRGRVCDWQWNPNGAPSPPR